MSWQEKTLFGSLALLLVSAVVLVSAHANGFNPPNGVGLALLAVIAACCWKAVDYCEAGKEKAFVISFSIAVVGGVMLSIVGVTP